MALATTFICFGMVPLLTFLGWFAEKHSKIFKLYWKNDVRNKSSKRVLRVISICGLNKGPYGASTVELGLQICEYIIEDTVILLLLDVI